MKIFLEYMYVFMFCATGGWVLEFIFRSIKNRKPINPGFLSGCCLPIYGLGGVVMYFLCSLDMTFISSGVWRVILLIAVAIVLMTLIEFAAGWFALKYYHTRLWDYSDRKFNYKGIICPLFSCLWGVICLGYYFVIFPFLSGTAVYVKESIPIILFLGIYYGVFLVDVVTSLDLLGRLKKYAVSVKQIINIEKIKLRIQEERALRKGKREAFILKMHREIRKYFDLDRIKDINKKDKGDMDL